MPEVTNKTRAAWAKTAIDAFRKECRTDAEDAIADLICNLMHLARATRGQSPEEAVARALKNFTAEEAGQ